MGTPMRLAAFCAMVCMLALPAGQPEVPFYPVALDYAADPRATPAAIESDLGLVRESTFNSIRTTVRWADVEPAPGEYAFTALKQVIETARRAGLQVIVRIDHTPPSWMLKRYADAQRQTAAEKAAGALCFDHPGARADLWHFVQVAATRARSFGIILTFEVGRPLPLGLCVCPYTKKRLDDSGSWHRDTPPSGIAASLNRDDLNELVRRTREAVIGAHVSNLVDVPTIVRELNGGPPGQDDWLARWNLDRVGVTIDASIASSARLGLALDDIGSAARGPQVGGGQQADETWWLAIGASLAERDRRFVTWASIARGASGLVYEDPPDRSLVATIARNPGLFASVRPRRARVALVLDPLSRASAQLLATVHAALTDAHIPIEILHIDEIREETIAGFRAVIFTSSRPVPGGASAEAVKGLVAAGGAFIDATSPAMSTTRVIEGVRSAGVSPDVRVEGSTSVDVRVLESADVQMIVALNHAEASQRVTMTFPRETQEAIWQNMETGASVNFIAGASGPSYTYWFRPKDALVLMIRKDIR